VDWGSRINVVKDKAILVLIDNFSWEFPAYDLAKNAVFTHEFSVSSRG